jgi:hypothetical protein
VALSKARARDAHEVRFRPELVDRPAARGAHAGAEAADELLDDVFVPPPAASSARRFRESESALAALSPAGARLPQTAGLAALLAPCSGAAVYRAVSRRRASLRPARGLARGRPRAPWGRSGIGIRTRATARRHPRPRVPWDFAPRPSQVWRSLPSAAGMTPPCGTPDSGW